MDRETLFPRDRVTIVGVLNVTPDSFSDGGRFHRGGAEAGAVPGREGSAIDLGALVDVAAELVAAGADWLDVGGESTRPGADPVNVQQEIERTAPAVEALAARFVQPISIDTRKAEVAAAALAAGASAVNDVTGLCHDPAVADVAASAGAGLLLGHIQGTPRTMQDAPRYDDVLREVADGLAASLDTARRAGVADARLAVDPGIGFGKRLEDNLQLIAHVGWLRERLGHSVCIGVSRKSFLGRLTGDGVGERDGASHAAEAVAVFAGADAIRVHDVAGARRAATVARALHDARRKELT